MHISKKFQQGATLGGGREYRPKHWRISVFHAPAIETTRKGVNRGLRNGSKIK
jgi:hypothetical protein